MRFRKLRITWSVVCGIACVLLVVLWVRSYWCRDAILYRTSGSGVFVLGSMRGKLITYGVASTTVTRRWELGSGKINSGEYFWADEAQYQGVFGFAAKDVLGFQFLSVPHWFPVLIIAVVATLPWLRWRFTLRTLLIVTTLVAVGLGLIVYMTRQ